MALRFLLIGLVAALGFEVPSAPDLASWGRSGRDWASARLADLSSLRAEAGRTLAYAVDCEREAEPVAPPPVTGRSPLAADLTFEAASEALAIDFSADIAQARAVEPAPAAEAVALADLEGRSALPSGEEMAAQAPADPEAIPSRVARLSSAVRLTREAAHAWAILIRPTDAVATR